MLHHSLAAQSTWGLRVSEKLLSESGMIFLFDSAIISMIGMRNFQSVSLNNYFNCSDICTTLLSLCSLSCSPTLKWVIAKIHDECWAKWPVVLVAGLSYIVPEPRAFQCWGRWTGQPRKCARHGEVGTPLVNGDKRVEVPVPSINHS